MEAVQSTELHNKIETSMVENLFDDLDDLDDRGIDRKIKFIYLTILCEPIFFF